MNRLNDGGYHPSITLWTHPRREWDTVPIPWTHPRREWEQCCKQHWKPFKAERSYWLGTEWNDHVSSPSKHDPFCPSPSNLSLSSSVSSPPMLFSTTPIITKLASDYNLQASHPSRSTSVLPVPVSPLLTAHSLHLPSAFASSCTPLHKLAQYQFPALRSLCNFKISCLLVPISLPRHTWSLYPP